MLRGLNDPVPHHCRHSQPNRAGHVDLPQDTVNSVGDRLRCGR
jgi:hypothetical protein